MIPIVGSSTQANENEPGRVPQADMASGLSPAASPRAPEMASSTGPKPPVTAKKAMMKIKPASTITKPWKAWVRMPPISPLITV